MEKEQQMLLLLFPSAVLTASGSKGISQHKAPLKFFVNVYYFSNKKKYFFFMGILERLFNVTLHVQTSDV